MKATVVWILAMGALARAQSGDGDGNIPDDVILACPLEESQDSLATILQHPTDCSKFYKCAHGLPVEMSCPKGLVFNDDIKVCDWPYNVDCSGRQQPSTAAPSSTQASEESCPAEDPQDGQAVLLPNPEDPGSFYICSWGVAYLQHCSPGLVFSSELRVCVWPRDLGSTTTTTTTTPTTTTTTTTTPRPVTCPPAGDENGQAVHLANPEDNTTFYKCSWGVPHLIRCPTGLVFDDSLKVCNWP